MTTRQSHDPQRRLLPLLRRHGWNATSFQVVETDFCYWFEDDAAVAYLDTGSAWVVAGAPIAAIDEAEAVSRRFAARAARAGKRVVFFAVEERFLSVAPMPSLLIGEQPWWNPQEWVARHRGHRGVKEQLRRARAKRVEVERVPSSVAAGEMRGELERLIARWLQSRVMPPMSFLVALEPFVIADERRYYVARNDGRAVGLLVAVPVYDRGGWFFEDILRDPCAPNGTAELMIDAAMRDVAADGSTFVTLGLAPLSGNARWLRLTRRLMRGFYNFEGVRAFKAKLRPDGWMPIYLAWPAGNGAAGAVRDTLDAFAGGRLARFTLRAVFRAPPPVMFALGALLIPWTFALTAAETRRWFPSRRVQLAWGAFDAAMATALLSLARKWRRPLAIATAIAAAGDGILATIEASRYNLPRKRTFGETLLIAAAVIAPFAAAAIMAGGLRARRLGD